MQEGQLCPHCEKGHLVERLIGDYDYLECDNCWKKQTNTISPDELRYFKMNAEERRKYWEDRKKYNND